MGTAVGAAGEVNSALRDAVTAMELNVEGIAQDIADALHGGIATLPDDPRSIQASARTAREIIRSFMRAFRTGEPLNAASPVPQSIKTAKALARSGGGLRHLLRVCHVGHGAFLHAWETELMRLDLPPEVRLAAATSAQQLSFAWMDVFSQRLSDEYERERDRLVRSGMTQRTEAIRSVLAGQVRDPDAMSRVLGYELGRHHTAMVLWSPENLGDTGARMERTASELAQALGAGKPLLLPVAGTVMWAWVATDGPPRGSLRGFALQHGVSAAVGDSASGAAGFRNSHRDADDTFRVAMLADRPPGTLVRYADAPLAAMLVGDVERTKRLVSMRLGALGTDDDHHARLRSTLRAYLEAQGSRQATAERLGIHANTVGNRVHACQAILGVDLGGRLTDLHVALELADRMGAAVLHPPEPAS